MLTPKELALKALRRTTDVILHSAAGVPADRWREGPVGCANCLCEVLEHLVKCEDWWLINVGVPVGERPPVPDASQAASAAEAAALFAAARRHLIDHLSSLPEGFFEAAVPACRYELFCSGAELVHYMAEHDSYHDGQIQMLEMAFADPTP